ncbi:uncharacterized protein N7483_010323 [Penicillium malachiteum]|uniref:uncharacterized protein n=1 Tax=Penicillium malachiteum TaxID=1324776 RepID=UPI002548E50E|nr:uncharacterized protein N7483_010323 [Penicillium malachiteum]KAJ5713142.1 hypothetical protein N7483_010323 [Penicillium malachiteum]
MKGAVHQAESQGAIRGWGRDEAKGGGDGCKIEELKGRSWVYTDNIQKTRFEKEKKDLEKVVKDSISENSRISKGLINSLINSLQRTVEVNMVDQACSDALTALNAYYKVAVKTFVDNVCRQVIERHLLTLLPSMFDPTLISSYSDKKLVHLAGESPSTIQYRVKTLKLQEALKQSIEELSQ